MDNYDLKPCPYCGSTNVGALYHIVDERYYVRCNDCHMQGPEKKYKALAQRAWQALPRQPKWTSETPKVPGWYFTRKDAHGYHVHVVFVKEEDRFSRKLKKGGMFFTMARTEEDESYIIDDFIQDDWKWAGPIPEPRGVEDE